jgi:hypothetical protein
VNYREAETILDKYFVDFGQRRHCLASGSTTDEDSQQRSGSRIQV